LDWRRPTIRYGVGSAQVVLLLLFVLVGLGPLLWLAKSAITPTQDTLTTPMSLFPHGFAWGNLREAWSGVEVGRYFWNTVVIACGSWFSQVFIATTAGYGCRFLARSTRRSCTHSS
jgi:multiple sugar transport system permease protein